MTARGEERTLDGRHARSQRTRRAIIDAVIALVLDGEAPTAKRVAARAGIAERTVFGHFPDLEALYAEATGQHLARVRAGFPPVEAGLAIGERIARLAARRGALLEAMLPMRRALAALEPTSEALRASRQAWTDASRAELATVFPDRLATAPEGEAGELQAAALAVVSLAFWEELRGGLTLDREHAQRVLERALRQVLAPDE